MRRLAVSGGVRHGVAWAMLPACGGGHACQWSRWPYAMPCYYLPASGDGGRCGTVAAACVASGMGWQCPAWVAVKEPASVRQSCYCVACGDGIRRRWCGRGHRLAWAGSVRPCSATACYCVAVVIPASVRRDAVAVSVATVSGSAGSVRRSSCQPIRWRWCPAAAACVVCSIGHACQPATGCGGGHPSGGWWPDGVGGWCGRVVIFQR